MFKLFDVQVPLAGRYVCANNGRYWFARQVAFGYSSLLIRYVVHAIYSPLFRWIFSLVEQTKIKLSYTGNNHIHYFLQYLINTVLTGSLHDSEQGCQESTRQCAWHGALIQTCDIAALSNSSCWSQLAGSTLSVSKDMCTINFCIAFG